MKKESCQTIQELLIPYLDGELSAEEKKQVREHLESCAVCRERLEEHAALWRLLGAFPAGIEVNLWPRIQLDLRKEEQRSRFRWFCRACAALLLFSFCLWFGQNRGFFSPQGSDSELLAEYRALAEVNGQDLLNDLELVDLAYELTWGEGGEVR